mgnify:CR=1 FL=1
MDDFKNITEYTLDCDSELRFEIEDKDAKVYVTVSNSEFQHSFLLKYNFL